MSLEYSALSSLFSTKTKISSFIFPPIITSLFPHHPPFNSEVDPRKDRSPVILFRRILFAPFLGLDERHVSFAESSQLNFLLRRTINPEVHHLFPANTYAFRAHTLRELRKKTSAWALLMTLFRREMWTSRINQNHSVVASGDKIEARWSGSLLFKITLRNLIDDFFKERQARVVTFKLFFTITF